ncbi:MAG: M16 family metallopeptidase, partial [Fidelibacterota bacterium]
MSILKIRRALFLVFLIFFLIESASAGGSKIFPYKVNQVILANGLKVVSIPFDSPGIIAYYTIVRAGSRNELEPGKSGFAHFFEHMMFRGTEKYPPEKYNSILKRLGSDSNAFTTDDYTAYHIVASSDALKTIIDIESDRFINLKYSEEAFKKEAGAVLGEYNKNFSIPYMTMFEKLRDAAYKVHTYKHTAMGFLKDIMDMPNQYEYSLLFFDRYYRPENTVILVVGDFDQEELISLVKEYYGSWERGTYEVEIPAEPPQKEEKSIYIPWKNRTLPYLLIGYHAPAFSDTSIDMPAIDVFSQLVFSSTSSLYKELVIKTQKVEFISGGASDRRDPPLFTIITRIKDEKDIEYVKDAIFNSIEEVKINSVSPERLAEIKSHMKYSFAMGLNTAGSVARTMAHYLNLTGDPETINRVYSLYDSVTPEDIKKVADKYFTPAN